MDTPMDILKEFPIRKTRAQKQAFRSAVGDYLQNLGYPVTVESGAYSSENLIAGDPDQAEFLITAHYDTCARLLISNMAYPFSLSRTLLWETFMILLLAVFPLPLALGLWWLTGKLWLTVIVWIIGAAVGLLLRLLGPANPSCVNDNSSGVVTLLEIAKSLPESARSSVCFVLFDLEERGCLGSAAYEKRHRACCRSQLVLNLDCVGDGAHIAMIPNKVLLKDPAAMAFLNRCCGWFGSRRIFLHRKGFAFYPSDQMNFPRGVGICALKKKKKLLYLDRIHTKNDKVLELTNVNLLRAAIVSLVTVRQ